MKYAIFVGIDKYQKRLNAPTLTGCWYDASRMSDKMKDWPQMSMLDGGATVAALKQVFAGFAAQMQDGDTLFYFQSSHGTAIEYMNTRTKTGRVMHDGILWDSEFVEMLKVFKKGVTVITVSDMCHAQSNSRTAANPNEKARFIECPDWAVPVQRAMPNLVNNQSVKCTRIHIGACKVDQTAKELESAAGGYERGGVFTTAMLANWQPSISETVKDAGLMVQRFEQTPTFELNRITNKKAKTTVWP